MKRSEQDQQYIDRLKAKIKELERRDTSRLRYIRMLRARCVQYGIGYPLLTPSEQKEIANG